MRSLDLPSLVAGVTVAGLGALLLLDDRGSLSLDFGALAPLVFAALGAILLALGLSRRA